MLPSPIAALSSVEGSILLGFTFASAIAWMDVARWVIGHVIMVSKNSGSYVLLTALAISLLAFLIGFLFSMMKRSLPKQQ